MAVSYRQLGALAAGRGDLAEALAWIVRSAALFDEFPHPATGPTPGDIRRLTAHLGVPALERAWLDVTGTQLPPHVRAFVLTDPDSGPNSEGDHRT
jgi:hypothetical protein